MTTPSGRRSMEEGRPRSFEDLVADDVARIVVLALDLHVLLVVDDF